MGRTLRLLVLGVLIAATASGQRDSYRNDLAYDGRFTFVRLRWKSDFSATPLIAARWYSSRITRAPSRTSRSSWMS